MLKGERMDALFESLGTTPSTVAVALVLFAVCVLIIRSELKKRKNGGGCSGCSGCSGSASGQDECPSCSIDVDALEKAVQKAEEKQRK